jgi:tRNA nucleotidyltransferase (CCA-adding enzyme)
VTSALPAARAVGQEMGLDLYVVGGAARAAVEEQAVRDVDLVVEGSGARVAEDVARRLAARLGGEVSAVPAFLGAHLALPDGAAIDVTVARRERYPRPAALPIVEPAGLEEDLRRRDFTLNAFALRLRDGQVVDPLGGIEDLRARRLRVLHDASFADDPTRVLRAIRLELERGFRMTPETESLARAASFAGLSGSRLREELRRLLDQPHRLSAALDRLNELGLLRGIDESVEWSPAAREGVARLAAALGDSILWRHAEKPPAWISALALIAAEPRRLAKRLELTGSAAEPLLGAPRRAAALAVALDADLAPSAVDELLGAATASELALVLAGREPRSRDQARRHLGEQRGLRLAIGGADLMAHGVAAGPAIGEALRRTRAARLDGRIERDGELVFALEAARGARSAGTA